MRDSVPPATSAAAITTKALKPIGDKVPKLDSTMS
jgi:hypothetical protein